eukprot:gene16027-24543_t
MHWPAVVLGVALLVDECESGVADIGFYSAQLWPGGAVQYVIDSASSNPGNPAAAPLAADDYRILEALARWETDTCIRFTKCDSVAACTAPYIKFVSDKDTCTSPIGIDVANGNVNVITLADTCGTGVVLNLIGHSVGLQNEQRRSDRDDFIIADLQQVGAAHVNEFSFGGAGWADIGPYDYESIMHDAGLAYAVGSHATMHAPGWHEIGQRAEISHGDHDTIDFLYNSCEATFVAPICTTSRDTSSVEVIPYGQPYTLTFAGHFSEDLTVTYPDTTSPAASTTFSMASGVNVGSRGSTKLGFHPTASENGNTFTLSATFTAGTQTVTCSHTVKVQSSAVCFGRPADDPLVCSGRGTCINSLTAPCTCGSGHAGIECEGTQTCQADTIRSFDAGSYAPWVASSNVAVDSTHSASGGGSMFLGSMTDVSVTGAAKLSVPMTNTRRVTFFGAVLSDQAAPLWAFKQGSTTCFTVTQNALGWAMGYREADRYPVNQVFDKLDIRIDWANQQTDLYIN